MKKILIALAMLAFIQVADAQVKSAADAKKAIATAEKACNDPKKASKVATWLKLGTEYMNAYNAPTGNVWIGANKQELALMMGSLKPTATETVTIQGAPMVKDVYADMNLYFNEGGQLTIIEVTNPVDPDALEKAAKAYEKAYEVDVKKSKTKDIADALKGIGEKYAAEAYNKYSLGDLPAASVFFEKAVDVAAKEPLSMLDTTSLYNAGFTAWAVKDMPRAKVFFERCYNAGYYYEGGEVFAKLADVDSENSGKYLEEGFTKFPESQSILIGLINYYINSKESTDKLFELLDKAKENEPDNASLYYVEGNIRSQLGDEANAVVAYEKCAEINPAYEFGYIGMGSMFYNKALAVQEKAQNELDDKKYMELVKQFEDALKACIDPFEKAYAITKDAGVKTGIAEYLKNTYYRFREEKPEYMAGYEKYAKILSEGAAK